MKESLKHVVSAALLCGIITLGALKAFAGDEGKCVLPVSVNTSITTASCQNGFLSDGGPYSGDGGCWTGNGQPASSTNCRGMNVVLQCNVDVCYDPTATAGGVASCASDYKVEFTNNQDPAYIYLKPGQGDIALIGVAYDGGCVVGVTDRAKPR